MYIDTNYAITLTHYGRTRQNKVWHDNTVARDNILLYVSDGSVTMKIGSDPYNATVGDVLLIPQNTIYSPVSCKNLSYYYFHFTATISTPPQLPSQIISDADPETFRYRYRCTNINTIISVPSYFHAPIDFIGNQIIKQITQINIWQHPEQVLLINNLFQKLLIHISLNDHPKRNNIHPILLNIVRYIDSNYTKNINTEQISLLFKISPSYLSKLFRTEMDTTLIKYINSVRLYAACHLLLSTELSIREISEQVGYNHQHYFNRVFQEFYQTTPSDFRRNESLL